MNVLFVGRSYVSDYWGGDRIYDEKLLKQIRTRLPQTSEIWLHRSSTRNALARAAHMLTLPTFLRYASAVNASAMAEATQTADVAIVSHEALAVPFLQSDTQVPTLFIMHNLLGAIAGKAGVRGALRSRSRMIENKLMKRGNTILGVLSAREYAIACDLWGGDRVALIPPGIGRIFASEPAGLVADRLFTGGTAEWGMKRRDFKAFMSHYDSDGRLPLLQNDSQIADDGALRIALVLDRFSTGFKLKAADLLGRNCALISLSSIKADFPETVRPDKCVIEIAHPDEIRSAIAEIASHQGEIAAEVTSLKLRLTSDLSWDVAGARVADALARLVKP